jgi:hypothetical protein
MKGILLLSSVMVLCFVSSWLRAAEPRLLPYSEPPIYGLTVAAPWENGGTLMINLPEHLEISEGGPGILRNTDKVPAGHWQAAEDGRSAVLDVESTTIPGARVKGTAKVVGSERVELTMRIDNGSTMTMPAPRPLYCLQYRKLTGFPQWQENFKHTFVFIDGKVVALADVKTATADAQVKGAAVRGVPQPKSAFVERFGGTIEEGIDAAIVAVTSLDGTRKVVTAWTPGRTMLSNSSIPCMHADPFYPELRPGASAEATGVVIFTEEPLEKVMGELLKAGAGAPPAQPSAAGHE